MPEDAWAGKKEEVAGSIRTGYEIRKLIEQIVFNPRGYQQARGSEWKIIQKKNTDQSSSTAYVKDSGHLEQDG